MRRPILVVALCAVATGAFGQSTTCNSYGRTTYCDTTQPPNYSGIQNSMGAFGAVLGAKIRDGRDQKARAARLSCMSANGPGAYAAYKDCLGAAAAGLDSPRESAVTVYEAARPMCAKERQALDGVLSSCDAGFASEAVHQAIRDDVLNGVLTLRSLAQPTSP